MFRYTTLEVETRAGIKCLTQREADLLRVLCENKGQVVKRDTLMKAVWGEDDYFVGRSMDVFISRLRKYLKDEPSIEIVNVYGVGFRLVEKE
ncbi:winged helix-turn-helix domain-containing protein [Roseivirga sp. BDSF3-8]|uniref:winged helix-turn-helix domain-containing protein n=1 Tax=Roseivirga sp. BDSF3-8 TaxID=3241598 RepID=UPI0035325840